MKYVVSFGGMDFSKGLTVTELYVGSNTNKINADSQPVIKTNQDLAEVFKANGVTADEPPTEVIQSLFIFNSSVNLIDNVANSHKFMVVTYGGSSYNITPDGKAPVQAGKGIASITVSDAGTAYTSNPDVVFSTGTAKATSTLKVVTATVSAGGDGYAVNDTITLDNGVVVKVATLNVAAVATVTIVDAGALTGNMLANPVAQTATSGAGAGATFTLAYGVGSVIVVEEGTYIDAPDVTFTGGAGNSAAATATLSADDAEQQYEIPININGDDKLKDTATHMSLTVNGETLLSATIPDSVGSVTDLVDWLNDNYGYLGTWSGAASPLTLVSVNNYQYANLVRFW